MRSTEPAFPSAAMKATALARCRPLTVFELHRASRTFYKAEPPTNWWARSFSSKFLPPFLAIGVALVREIWQELLQLPRPAMA